MPEITAFSKFFRDVDALIGACNENGGLLPGHESLMAEVEARFTQAKEAKVTQESLEGNRLAATADVLEKVDAAKEAARKLRSFIVSVLGPRSPYLPLFGIAPKPTRNLNRSRRRKPQPEEPENPPAPEVEAAEPAAPAKPE
ncbi:MAG TPA: hypothetical protein VGX68_06630 [Thermoanaerobaculia bacterium]|jgi:hypothetical protein|nr:hypothetical protein [Thermoanaerobaculia bacterium]